MSRERSQVKVGMILSYLNLGIGNLIPFFYTPIMLQLLGQNEYGLYKIASSTTSYLSLMAFGIGSAVSRFLIRARTKEGGEAEQRMFGLFNLIFQVITVLTLVVGSLVTWKLDWLYAASLTMEELSRMRMLVGLMVINMAIGFSATSYNALVNSHERFVFLHTVNIVSTVGGPILNLIVLFMGYRSIGMTVAGLLLNVVIRIAYIIYVRNVLRVRPRYRGMPKGVLKEIVQFSFWVFISNIVGQLYNSTDMVIIGMIPTLATTGAAIYSIGSTFISIIFSLAQVTPGFFTPRINKMYFGRCTDSELSDLVIKVGRLQGYIVLLFCSGFIAFGRQFIQWYVGDGYQEAYWVAIIVMIPNCIPLVQSAAHAVLQAKNMHKFRSLMLISMAIANVVGTIFLVKQYGIIGAAIPTGLCYLIGNGFVLNWYYWKKVHLDIPRFWKNIAPIACVSLILCAVTLLVSQWLDFYNIGIFFVGIVVFTLLYGLLLWCFVMNEYEKELLKKPIRKIIKQV